MLKRISELRDVRDAILEIDEGLYNFCDDECEKCSYYYDRGDGVESCHKNVVSFLDDESGGIVVVPNNLTFKYHYFIPLKIKDLKKIKELWEFKFEKDEQLLKPCDKYDGKRLHLKFRSVSGEIIEEVVDIEEIKTTKWWD